MRTLLKIGLPLVCVVALMAFGWLFLMQSSQSENAQKAADQVYNAAEKALTSVLSGDGDGAEGTDYVSVGAIYTSSGNLHATLIVRGPAGVEAVCNRIQHVRDYLVVLLSDFPPDPTAPSAGPAGYDGSISESLNELVGSDAVERIRFDPYHQGGERRRATC